MRAVQQAREVHREHASHSSVGASTIGPSSMTPALLTSTSRRPSSATVRSTAPAAACGVGDVGRDDERGAAGLADLIGQLLEAVGPARDEGHRGALAGQAQRRRLADPARRAGDQRDPLRPGCRSSSPCPPSWQDGAP